MSALRMIAWGVVDFDAIPDGNLRHRLKREIEIELCKSTGRRFWLDRTQRPWGGRAQWAVREKISKSTHLRVTGTMRQCCERILSTWIEPSNHQSTDDAS